MNTCSKAVGKATVSPPGGGGGVVEFWSRSDPQDLDLGPNSVLSLLRDPKSIT